MIYTMFLFYCFFLSFMGKFHEADGASFVEKKSRLVYANRSQSTDLTWEYILGSGDILTLLLCGYVINNNNMVEMVRKTQSGPATVASPVPSPFQGRLTVVEDGKIIGMRIGQARVEDQRDYYCSLQSKKSDVNINPVLNSFYLTISIMDPPKFVNCLSSSLTVIEGQNTNFSCSVFGNPVPTLTCNLLLANGVQRDPFGNVKQNISTKLISNVQQNYDMLSCVADGGAAGRSYITKKFTVLHVPTKVVNARRVSSTTSSIDVAWGLPLDDGGKPLQDYLVEYGVNLNSLTGKNVTPSSSPQTKLTQLEAKKTYYIRIKAKNGLGYGEHVQFIAETIDFAGSGKRTDDSNDNIKIIVPVVVAVVLLVVIIGIGCYLKRRKSTPSNLPDTYIEEAVGYPPNDKGMYAQVDKTGQKMQLNDGESTSGYPDILHPTKGRPAEENMNEVDYPASEEDVQRPFCVGNGSVSGHPADDDEEMSPSYENSRKEYV